MILEPGRAINVSDMPIDLEPLPDSEVFSGTPASGAAVFTNFSGSEIGVWEMTLGTATDVEADEVFVVLAGRARLEFTDRDLPPVELVPGVVVRLESGMHTVWTVTEPLRKLWIG